MTPLWWTVTVGVGLIVVVLGAAVYLVGNALKSLEEDNG